MANTLPGTPYVESSDLVANYPAVSESLAERVDLVGILPFATSTARGTALPTPTDGQFSYLQDSNTTEFWNGSAWQNVSKILQVVRATDTTDRTTSSTSFVDVTGMTITITPQKSTSGIIVVAVMAPTVASTSVTNPAGVFRIADSSGNALSGASEMWIGGAGTITGTARFSVNLWGYSTPGTTSATTYKMQFRILGGASTVATRADSNPVQMYAIEVAA